MRSDPLRMVPVLLLGLLGANTEALGEEHLPPAASDDRGSLIGNYIDRKLVVTRLLVLEESINRKVNEVGRRVVLATGVAGLEVQIRILSDPVVGAAATSGRFIYVSSGLLDFVESEDELAAVIARQLVHLMESRLLKLYRAKSARKKAKTAAVAGFLIGAGVYAASTLGDVAGIAVTAAESTRARFALVGELGDVLGKAYNEITVVGYASALELEADRGAERLLERAGYDPGALERLLQRSRAARNNLELDDALMASPLFNAKPGLEKRLEALGSDGD